MPTLLHGPRLQAAKLTHKPSLSGVSGKLLQNTLVMYDRQTERLWSQLYGAALDDSGHTLAFFPSIFTEWAAWYMQYPESQVLSKEATCAQFDCGNYASNPRGSYAVDPYASYYNSARGGCCQPPNPTRRWIISQKARFGPASW